jgi:hypothetical protein
MAGKSWHQVCCSRAVDAETVLMKDTKARAIAPIVRKSDTPDALGGTAPVAGEGAFPGPHSSISTFG